ncbi:MAG: hypothetical protein M1840_001422 [Geoglossum simile]|nr:MAG: hypothetical protein M1840_001422 [Geoglossum simile]
MESPAETNTHRRARPLNYYLRRTTRNPIFLHPLHWTSHHINYLRLSVTDLPFTTLLSSNPEFNHRAGCSRCRQVKVLALTDHRIKYIERKVSMTEDTFRTETYMIVKDYFCTVLQSFKPPKYPRINAYDEAQKPLIWEPISPFREKYCSVTIQIGNASADLTTLLVVRRYDSTPLFAFNTEYEKWSRLYYGEGYGRRGARVKFGDMEQCAGLEPYDAAILLGLAQEKQRKNTEECPEIWSYLITPSKDRSGFHLYAACFPNEYLRAIHDPNIPLQTEVTIQRYRIGFNEDLLSAITALIDWHTLYDTDMTKIERERGKARAIIERQSGTAIEKDLEVALEMTRAMIERRRGTATEEVMELALEEALEEALEVAFLTGGTPAKYLPKPPLPKKKKKFKATKRRYPY